MMWEATTMAGGVDAIHALAPEWSALCDEGACPDPFLRPEWFTALAESFGYDVELITIRRTGRLRAVLPVMSGSARMHGLPVKRLGAAYNLNTQRFDLIHGADHSEKPAVLNELWKSLKKRRDWTVAEMRLVRKDSWIADLLELAEADGYRTGIWQMDAAPYITLPDEPCSINELLRNSRKQLRQQLDRRKRRLAEAGDLEYSVSRSYSPDLVDRFLDVETQGWKGRKGTAVAADASVVDMHHRFARSVGDRGWLRGYEFRLDGRTIAMCLNIRCGDDMYHWKTAYDEAFGRFSPGNILFKMFVADCLAQGVKRIDLLSPSTINKRYWTSLEREHVAFYIFQPGIVGTLLWAWKFLLASTVRKFRTRNAVLTPAYDQK